MSSTIHESLTLQAAAPEHYAGAFFSEGLIDEMARAAWRDPVQYRRELLPGGSRLRRVLDEAARVSGWSRPLPSDRARGIALSAGQGAVTAHVAELSLDAQGASQVHRVVAVIDCGATQPDVPARHRIEQNLMAWLGEGCQATLDVRYLASPLAAVACGAPASAAPVLSADSLAPAVANALAQLERRRRWEQGDEEGESA